MIKRNKTSEHCAAENGEPRDASKSENTNSTGGEKALKLRRQIGIFSGICLVVNMMVGSGIFVVPTGILKYCNGNVIASLIIWAVAGIIATICSLCLAELGSSIRESGSWISFLNFSFGGFPSFLYAWLVVCIGYPEGIAAQINALGEYLTRLYFDEDCEFPLLPATQKLLGIFVFMIIAAINVRSVKLAVRIQAICAVGKIVALVGVAGTGIVQLIRDSSIAQQNFFPEAQNATNESSYEMSDLGDVVGISGLSLALYQGLWAYNGLEAITYVTEEVKNPARSLPIILYCSVPAVTLLYIFVNVAYFSVLTPEEMISSHAVAVTFGLRIHPVMAYLMTLSVCLSVIGTLNALLLVTGRLPFVSARLGHMPEFLSMAHVHYISPAPAILLNSILAILMALSNSFEVLITAKLFTEWGFKGLSFAGLLYLRKTKPNLERPYKVFPLTAVVAVLISIILIIIPLVFQPKPLYLVSVAFLVVFAGVYFFVSKGKLVMTGIGKVGLFVQKLLLVVPTSKEDIG